MNLTIDTDDSGIVKTHTKRTYRKRSDAEKNFLEAARRFYAVPLSKEATQALFQAIAAQQLEARSRAVRPTPTRVIGLMKATN